LVHRAEPDLSDDETEKPHAASRAGLTAKRRNGPLQRLSPRQQHLR
jgi:hypothetical protein